MVIIAILIIISVIHSVLIHIATVTPFTVSVALALNYHRYGYHYYYYRYSYSVQYDSITVDPFIVSFNYC